jgi:hypothetical protein
MNKSRRIGAIVAMATTAVGMASMTASAPASAAPARGPEPVSGWLRPVPAHTTSSIDIYWRTDRTICDVQVRVAGAWVDVEYPGHRRFASFDRGTMLRAGRTDYTTVRVSPDVDRSAAARLRAVITYDNCTFHSRPQAKSLTLTLPVLRNDNWPGHGFPGGPGNGGPGNGWPGNGGPGNGGPGNGGPGNGGPGNGGPGNGGPGNGGPGNGGPGNGGPGNGGPGNGGPGNGGPGNGGPGNGGPGNGGPGNGGPGNGGPGHDHGQPPTTNPGTTTSPNSNPAPTTSPTASPTTSPTPGPTTSPTTPGGNGQGGNGQGGNGQGGNHQGGNGNGDGGHTHGPGSGGQGPQSPDRRS